VTGALLHIATFVTRHAIPMGCNATAVDARRTLDARTNKQGKLDDQECSGACRWQNPYLPVFGQPPGSAHCMVYSADWWEAYNVHESMLDFRVTVSINATDSNVTSLQLQPSSPRGRSADGAVGASLTGDLLPYSAFPVLSSKYLLMPSLGSVQTLDPNKWMVLDPSMLTFDGTECNKIGVGFNAFRWVALAHCKQLVL
jgi:Male gamete fusion factor